MKKSEIEQHYLAIPYDLRTIIYELEDAFGCEVGGGEIFGSVNETGKGRKLTSDSSFIRLIALHLGNVYLGYSTYRLAKILNNSKQLVYYANENIPNHIETNPIFRTKLRGICFNNGLTSMVDEINKIQAEREKAKRSV